MSSAGAVEKEKLEEAKGVHDAGARSRRDVDGCVKSFEKIPHTGRNGWLNLVRFWRKDYFSQLHKHQERTFRDLGPIYR